LRTPKQNLHALSRNPNPGDGLILGRDEKGKIVQVYWIMDRSENSRARVLVSDGDGTIRIVPREPSRLKQPELVIYNAMREEGDIFAVSNGQQTDDIVEMEPGNTLLESLRDWKFESDEPCFTSRISGVTTRNGKAQIAVLRHSTVVPGSCERRLYQYDKLPICAGWCVHTHAGDGNPPPSFVGDPFLLPLPGELSTIANTIWNNLNPTNRVALVARVVEKELLNNHIINAVKQ
jgi:hypothetical protein